jgi:hypothetical protein
MAQGFRESRILDAHFSRETPISTGGYLTSRQRCLEVAPLPVTVDKICAFGVGYVFYRLLETNSQNFAYQPNSSYDFSRNPTW